MGPYGSKNFKNATPLTVFIPARTLRSASKNLIEIPPTNLKTHGPRSFSVAAPTFWNAVP